jgi:hypothetical protein
VRRSVGAESVNNDLSESPAFQNYGMFTVILLCTTVIV